jgi:predicted transcriptional regulator
MHPIIESNWLCSKIDGSALAAQAVNFQPINSPAAQEGLERKMPRPKKCLTLWRQTQSCITLYFNMTRRGKPMQKLEAINFRIEAENKIRLRQLAESTGRDQSELAREAFQQYLDIQEWQINGIHEALAAADRGEFADDADIEAIFDKYTK